MAVDQEELAEKSREEEQETKQEYLQFRRQFDKLKVETKGIQSDSEKLKANGNNFFKLGLYMQASMMYSEAIDLQPNSAVLYCNRAMAYLKQDMPHEALADAEKSLELDSSGSNIKAYWRKAQSLLDLARPTEAEATADEGLALEPGNQHLNRVRRKAREACTLRRLCGEDWAARMENGVEKRYTFKEDGSLKITVFGHALPATFELSVEGWPRSMVVRMSPEAVGVGNGPPPPPRPYIYEFHDADRELWLCQPMGTNELPTKFEGPGLDRLRRAAPLAAPAEEDAADAEPLDMRCGRYIEEMNRIMPLIPPQLPEQPSDEQVNQEILIMDQISTLKRRCGMRVHQRAVELAKNPASAASPELEALALELQRRFVARKIIPPPAPPPAPPLAAEAQASAAAAAVARPAVAKAPPARPKSALGCLSGVARLCGGGGG